MVNIWPVSCFLLLFFDGLFQLFSLGLHLLSVRCLAFDELAEVPFGARGGVGLGLECALHHLSILHLLFETFALHVSLNLLLADFLSNVALSLFHVFEPLVFFIFRFLNEAL